MKPILEKSEAIDKPDPELFNRANPKTVRSEAVRSTTALSGVGVIDKTVAILSAVEAGSLSLAELTVATGINRATAHRLASALEHHGLLRRVDGGHFGLGYRLWLLGQAVPGVTDLADRIQPYLDQLRDRTGESAQFYVRDGDERVCLAVAESVHGLRTIVPVGARLTLERGSAGAVFRQHGPKQLSELPPTRGWVESVAEREPGVASVSAPVLNASGELVAVLSVSGPIERTTTSPGSRYGDDVSKIAGEMATAVV